MFKIRFYQVSLLVIILATFLLSACTADKGNHPQAQHLNYCLINDSLTVDTGKFSQAADFQVVNSLFEGLIRMKPDGTYEKAMAESWQVEDNGTRYIFKLRNTQWSNEERVTAYDFAYAWKRLLNPNNKSMYAYMLFDVKNAEAYYRSENGSYGGKKIEENDVAIKALDEETLEVILNKGNATFIKKLNHPALYPLPKKAIENNNELLENIKDIPKNGPYLVNSYEAGVKLELKKNDKYWDQENVKLESMTWFITDSAEAGWKMYEKNEVDVLVNVPQSIIEKEKGIKYSPLLANYYYKINTARTLLDKKEVRQALSMALNRKTLVDNILRGGQTPAEGIVPFGSIEKASGKDFREIGGNLLPDNDIKKAKELLAQVNFGKDQEQMSLELLISDQEAHLFVAEELKKEWQENLGISLKIVPLKWEELITRTQKRDYDLALMGWHADFADPLTFMEFFVRGNANNDTGWSNEEFDKNIELATTNNEEQVRMQALHEAEKILLEEMPLLPVFDYTRDYVAKDYVKGLFLPPVGPEAELKWVYIE